MSSKVCFVALFALLQVCFAASSSAAVSAAAASSSLSKVSFVAVFVAPSSALGSSLSKVSFAVSSSAVASSLSKVSSSAAMSSCAVASSSAAVSSLPKVCFAVSSSVVSSCTVASSSAAVSSCAVASSSAAASLALWKNRATTLAGWRTISLSKSTSFSCETHVFCFCIFCLIGCTFDNRKFATNPKRYLFQKMVVENLVAEKKTLLYFGALSTTEKTNKYKKI